MKLITILIFKIALTSSAINKISIRKIGWGTTTKRQVKTRLLTLPEYIRTLPPIHLPRPKPKPSIRHPRGHDAR